MNKLKSDGVLNNTYVFFTSTTVGKAASTAYRGRSGAPTKRASTCRSWCVVLAWLRAPPPTSWPSTPTTCPPLRTWRAHRSRATSTGAPCGPVLKGNATTWRTAILLEAARALFPQPTQVSVPATTARSTLSTKEVRGTLQPGSRPRRADQQAAQRLRTSKGACSASAEALKTCGADTQSLTTQLRTGNSSSLEATGWSRGTEAFRTPSPTLIHQSPIKQIFGSSPEGFKHPHLSDAAW